MSYFEILTLNLWEIAEKEMYYLYGSIDGRYPKDNLIRELNKDERNFHARESQKECGKHDVLKVEKVLMYKKKLKNGELRGYNMELLGSFYKS